MKEELETRNYIFDNNNKKKRKEKRNRMMELYHLFIHLTIILMKIKILIYSSSKYLNNPFNIKLQQ